MGIFRWSKQQRIDRALRWIRHAERCRASEPVSALILLHLARLAIKGTGFRSASLHRSLGELLDRHARPEAALAEFQRAIRIDPLDVQARAGLEKVAARIRSMLVSPERPADDPEIARLYLVLLRADCAGVGAHLAMVRHWVARGELVPARELALAVTKLHPSWPEAWQLLAEVARAQGDEALALQAEAAAAPGGLFAQPTSPVRPPASA